jgi:hypothetical protein
LFVANKRTAVGVRSKLQVLFYENKRSWCDVTVASKAATAVCGATAVCVRSKLQVLFYENKGFSKLVGIVRSIGATAVCASALSKLGM